MVDTTDNDSPSFYGDEEKTTPEVDAPPTWSGASSPRRDELLAEQGSGQEAAVQRSELAAAIPPSEPAAAAPSKPAVDSPLTHAKLPVIETSLENQPAIQALPLTEPDTIAEATPVTGGDTPAELNNAAVAATPLTESDTAAEATSVTGSDTDVATSEQASPLRNAPLREQGAAADASPQNPFSDSELEQLLGELEGKPTDEKNLAATQTNPATPTLPVQHEGVLQGQELDDVLRDLEADTNATLNSTPEQRAAAIDLVPPTPAGTDDIINNLDRNNAIDNAVEDLDKLSDELNEERTQSTLPPNQEGQDLDALLEQFNNAEGEKPRDYDPQQAKDSNDAIDDLENLLDDIEGKDNVRNYMKELSAIAERENNHQEAIADLDSLDRELAAEKALRPQPETRERRDAFSAGSTALAVSVVEPGQAVDQEKMDALIEKLSEKFLYTGENYDINPNAALIKEAGMATFQFSNAEGKSDGQITVNRQTGVINANPPSDANLSRLVDAAQVMAEQTGKPIPISSGSEADVAKFKLMLDAKSIQYTDTRPPQQTTDNNLAAEAKTAPVAPNAGAPGPTPLQAKSPVPQPTMGTHRGSPVEWQPTPLARARAAAQPNASPVQPKSGVAQENQANNQNWRKAAPNIPAPSVANQGAKNPAASAPNPAGAKNPAASAANQAAPKGPGAKNAAAKGPAAPTPTPRGEALKKLGKVAGFTLGVAAAGMLMGLMVGGPFGAAAGLAAGALVGTAIGVGVARFGLNDLKAIVGIKTQAAPLAQAAADLQANGPQPKMAMAPQAKMAAPGPQQTNVNANNNANIAKLAVERTQALRADAAPNPAQSKAPIPQPQPGAAPNNPDPRMSLKTPVPAPRPANPKQAAQQSSNTAARPQAPKSSYELMMTTMAPSGAQNLQRPTPETIMYNADRSELASDARNSSVTPTQLAAEDAAAKGTPTPGGQQQPRQPGAPELAGGTQQKNEAEKIEGKKHGPEAKGAAEHAEPASMPEAAPQQSGPGMRPT